MTLEHFSFFFIFHPNPKFVQLSYVPGTVFLFLIFHPNFVNTVVSALPGCMFSTSISDSTTSPTLNLYKHLSTAGSGNKVSCNHYLMIRRWKIVIYCVHSDSFTATETTSDAKWRIRFPKSLHAWQGWEKPQHHYWDVTPDLWTHRLLHLWLKYGGVQC